MQISVVTPSLNQARFLAQCLESVRIQRGCDVEHVVFDGGSTDGTLEILQRCGPEVRWVSRRDRGQADAVNQGIRATGGEIVGWLNSDDFYYPGAFAAVAEAFAADDSVDVVYGMADLVDIDGVAYEQYATEQWNAHRLAEVCFICQPALFFRRRVTAIAGLLDDRLHYCMDYEYWLRLADHGLKFRHLPVRLAASRMYPTNKSLGSRVRVHAEINAMMRSRLGATPDLWLFNFGDALAGKWVDGARFPQLYRVCRAAGMVYAALRWNGRVGKPMMRKIASRAGAMAGVSRR